MCWLRWRVDFKAIQTRLAHSECKVLTFADTSPLPIWTTFMTLPVNTIGVDRYWLLTCTTYGTWLPGDHRGFVGTALDEHGNLINYNQPSTPAALPNTKLESAITQGLKCPPIVFQANHAGVLFKQFEETTRIRQWLLIAVAIMRTHWHIVVGVPNDPDPEKIRGDLKAYGSRCLNRAFTKPASDTWWSDGGSNRKLPDEDAVEAAVLYVRQQSNPLLIWTRETGRLI